ncbi:diacylglyceryl transferase [Taibaiella sp. KBW10]|uniref:prolipoprotein diacylglyceryl transferase n=1 Tax=Taibaiella sp. KBW10 TaxID=2153357 RepID=UPI000F59293A|nr:prolipoprotein diacylglyceryl transferase family protein [Taibaiella sp. KBW10]RQO32105.1 diacylglyceryl transferase [Taibaiella sp. KBW10]
MYPDFHYLIKSLLGLDIPALGILKTFGFFVAMGFIFGAIAWQKELKRKAQLGLVLPQIKVNSKTGQKESIYPHQRISDFIFVAAIAGFIGAKVFNALETWSDFIQDPIGSLFSRSGLTFYGGLIVATAALYYFAKKIKLDFRHLCDAAAPALILAYGIGRLGCHFSGDGDWGIYNSAYVTQADGTLTTATTADFDKTVIEKGQYMQKFEGKVPHIYYPAPSFLPRWFVAMNYKHNVNNEGMQIAGDQEEYNSVLPVAVFPTSVWEFLACTLIIFPVLWGLRKRLGKPLQLFGVYLIFNGLERFLVEKIRVNTRYDLGFIHPTQAEIISFAFIIIGIFLLLRKHKTSISQPA